MALKLLKVKTFNNHKKAFSDTLESCVSSNLTNGVPLLKLMSSPDKLTGEKATNAVNTDDFGGSSARLDDPGGGNALSSSSVESTELDHM